MLKVLSLLLVAAPLVADPISDLRAVLQKYPAKSKFVASATFNVSQNAQEKAANVQNGSTTLEIESGAGGLAIRVPQAALDAAKSEEGSKKRDPKSATPTRLWSLSERTGSTSKATRSAISPKFSGWAASELKRRRRSKRRSTGTSANRMSLWPNARGRGWPSSLRRSGPSAVRRRRGGSPRARRRPAGRGGRRPGAASSSRPGSPLGGSRPCSTPAAPAPRA